jgi:uncharacterized protein
VRRLILALAIVLPLVPAGSQQAAPAPRANLQYQFNVTARMRDGVLLAANLYMPAAGGRYPAILIRTPYGKGREQQDALFFAARGYAVVVQDVRGRNDSDGPWYPWANEARDGYDTIEWVARQPWCNGKVATFGASYLGMDQWQAATQMPPHLAAMVPIVAPSDLYRGVFHPGGVFEYGTMLTWAFLNSRRTDLLPAIPLVDWNKVFRHLPAVDSAAAAGFDVSYYRDWIEHDRRDVYWQNMSWDAAAANSTVPVFIVAGWFDIFHAGSLENYASLMAGGTPELRRAHRLLVGPWAHGGPVQKLGDMEFGASAAADPKEKIVRWLDHYVQGQSNGAEADPAVDFFLMGANQWRSSASWPPAGMHSVSFYLHSQGGANGDHGHGVLTEEEAANEATDSYTYDPAPGTHSRRGDLL